jgi:hypothetical protein
VEDQGLILPAVATVSRKVNDFPLSLQKSAKIIFLNVLATSFPLSIGIVT